MVVATLEFWRYGSLGKGFVYGYIQYTICATRSHRNSDLHLQQREHRTIINVGRAHSLNVYALAVKANYFQPSPSLSCPLSTRYDSEKAAPRMCAVTSSVDRVEYKQHQAVVT